MTPRIDAQRLWDDLMELGRIGWRDGQGVTRTALSAADLEAKAWLTRKMEQAGLAVVADAAYNQIGVLHGKRRVSGKTAVLGSHLDSVPNGGMFDGSLGVLAALECARTIGDNRITLPWNLEVINFCDEEAAHFSGTVGSRAMTGLLSEGEIQLRRFEGAPTFAEDLEAAGKDPARIMDARRDQAAFSCFLELHIEQGINLESAATDVGAVTAIAGIHRYRVTVEGRAAHAGGTPMHLREDALVKAAPFFTLLPNWLQHCNPNMVGTIGQLQLEPGAPNVVPGRCCFVVELRSQELRDMQIIGDQIKAYAAAQSGWQMEMISEKGSVVLDERLVSIVEKAALIESYSCRRLVSGAGHDAQSFATVGVPSGMIFIPCRDGMSHSPHESITREQAAHGCQVLFNTLMILAEEYQPL